MTVPSLYQQCGLVANVYRSLVQGGQHVEDYVNELSTLKTVKAAFGGWLQGEVQLCGDGLDVDGWIEDGLWRHVEIRDTAGIIRWAGFANRITVAAGDETTTVGPALASPTASTPASAPSTPRPARRSLV